MSHYHAVVWIDHQKAVVWQFSADAQESVVVKAPSQHQRVHDRHSPHGGHRALPDHEFFAQVAQSISGAHEILIIGPAQAKQELAKYLRESVPLLGQRIVAVENADHPTDHQVLAYARKHFTAIDRMLAQPGSP